MAKSLALDFLPEELIIKLSKKRKRVHKTCSDGCGHSEEVGECLRTNSPLHEQCYKLITKAGNGDLARGKVCATNGIIVEDQICPKYARHSTTTRKSRSPPLCPGLSLSAFRRPETTVRLLNDCDISSRLDADYDLSQGGRILGHGSSSTVKLAVRKSDGMRVAVKCLPKHEILRNYCLLDEFQLLRQISHPNIIRFYDVYEAESDLFLVMELCDCGDLYSKIVQVGKFNEEQAKRIIHRVLLALQYLHDLNIVHRDVKPENILLSDINDVTKVKLTDFGLAKRMLAEVSSVSDTVSNSPDDRSESNVRGNRRRTYSRVGSDHYSAPEMNTGGGYDTAVDLYSLGVCAYVLLHGHTPPSNCGLDSEASFEPHSFKGLSTEAKDLISSLLRYNPQERPTAADALSHAWFSSLVNNGDAPVTSGLDVKNAEVLKQTVDMAKEWTSGPQACLLEERDSLPLLLTVPIKQSVENGCEPIASVLNPSNTSMSRRLGRSAVSSEEESPFEWEEKLYSLGQPIPRVTPR